MTASPELPWVHFFSFYIWILLRLTSSVRGSRWRWRRHLWCFAWSVMDWSLHLPGQEIGCYRQILVCGIRYGFSFINKPTCSLRNVETRPIRYDSYMLWISLIHSIAKVMRLLRDHWYLFTWVATEVPGLSSFLVDVLSYSISDVFQ